MWTVRSEIFATSLSAKYVDACLVRVERLAARQMTGFL